MYTAKSQHVPTALKEISLKGKQPMSCVGRGPGNNFSQSKVFLVTQVDAELMLLVF